MAFDTAQWAQAMIDAFDGDTPYPAPSGHDEPVAEADAYRIQNALVTHRLANDTLYGFKAALTAPVAQQAMGADAPITGVLFGSGNHPPTAPVRPPAHRRLLIETELGFVTNETIDAPVAGSDLRQRVRSCAPAIELAHMGFGDARPNGTDLICANSASGAFLLGNPVDPDAVDLNAITATLTRDDVQLHAARAGDVMGDQWAALEWLINRVVAQGYELPAGCLLMTGSIGMMHPGQPGHYVANYGDLGEITFDVAGG